MRALLGLLAVAVLVPAAGCKKESVKLPPKPSAAEQPAAPVPGGAQDTNYQPGAGAAVNAYRAGKRAVAQSDMNQLGLIITQMCDLNNRMPDVNAIKAELKTVPNLLAMITDGSVVLTGTSNRSGLWAYQAGADTQGGIALVAGTASRMTAEEIKNAPR